MLHHVIILGKEILLHYVSEWKVTGRGTQDIRKDLSISRTPVFVYLIPTKFSMHQKKGKAIKDRDSSLFFAWVKEKITDKW